MAAVPLNVCKKFRALLRSEAERYRTGENAENEMVWVYLNLDGDFSIYRVEDVAPWPRPVQWFVAGFNGPEMAEDIDREGLRRAWAFRGQSVVGIEGSRIITLADQEAEYQSAEE